MSSLPEGFNSTDTQDDELQHDLEVLRKTYHLSIQPAKDWDKEKEQFFEVNSDLTARLLGAMQPLNGLLSNQAIMKSFEGAVKFVVPANLPANAQLLAATKLGSNTFYGDYYTVMPNGAYRFVGKGGFEPFDAKTANFVQLTSTVFAIASIATQQYFLKRIDDKLEKIQKTTRDILQFLELDKRTHLQSQDSFLAELYHNAAKIIDCPIQRQASVTTVQNIRMEAQAAVLFYQARAEEHAAPEAKENSKQMQERLEKVATNIQFYWYSLQIYCRATVLELILTGNEDHDYLQRIKQDLLRRCAEFQSCVRQWNQNEKERIQTIGANNLSVLLAKTAEIAGAMAVGAGAWAAISAAEKELPLDMDTAAKLKITASCSMAGFAYQAIDSTVQRHDQQAQNRKEAWEKYCLQTRQYSQAEELTSIANSVEILDQLHHSNREFVLYQNKLYLKDVWSEEKDARECLET